MAAETGDSRKDRTRAIAEFATLLRGLRASAGTPSFREMAGRSRAISHTTLHEAAQGHRLPSWATTAEFIKACGTDPEDYRDRWEAANSMVAGGRIQAPLNGHPLPADTDPVAYAPAATDPPTDADPDGKGDEDDEGDAAGDGTADADAARGDDARRPALLRRRYTVTGASVAGTAAVIVIGVALLPQLTDDPATPPEKRQVTSADCPVRQQNPLPEPPTHKGDSAAFVADITLPDCSHVAQASRVEKVWRFKNRGTVAWHGYTLHRIDLPQHRNQCQTIVDTPIPDTPPGAIVDIRTWVVTPPEPGFCFVRFKMRDGEGKYAFPGSRPVYFQLIID